MIILLLTIFHSVLSQENGLAGAGKVMKYWLHDSYSLVQLEGRACHGHIFTSYGQSIKLKILRIENVKYMMVSSDIRDDCHEFNWIGCAPTDKYCRPYDSQHLQSAINDDQEIQIDPCLQEVYIYIVPSDPSQASRLWTYSSQSSSNCQPLVEDPCSSQSYEYCKNHRDTNCGKISCIMNSRLLRGYCFSDVDETRAFEVCNASAAWSASESRELEFFVIQPVSDGSLLNIILMVMVSLGAMVCCCSIYYRYRLKSDGFAPFKPPAACPSCLFPVPQYIEDDYASINNGMIPLNIIRSLNN